MTKTYQRLIKLMPPWLASIFLYFWYTALILGIIVLYNIPNVRFIYWGH